MDEYDPKWTAILVARGILALYEENLDLADEVTRLRKVEQEYRDKIYSDIAFGREQHANILKSLLEMGERASIKKGEHGDDQEVLE